jgi:hypothetical protein
MVTGVLTRKLFSRWLKNQLMQKLQILRPLRGHPF